jgi:cell division protein FtsB
MKKTLIVAALAFSFGLPLANASYAAEAKNPKTELSEAEKKEIVQIKNRVEEIRTMDKSELSSTEKKALRKELKELKKRADFLGDRVTLSVGAIIIILLLLIIIL